MSDNVFMNEPLSEREWGDLLDGIKNEKCIVCVGPQILSSDPTIPFEKNLAAFLDAQAKDLNIRVYDNGWFLLLPEGNESSPYRQVREFYKTTKSNATVITHKLAKIPFHLLLNFNPEDSIKTAFEGYDATFETHMRHNRNNASGEFQNPTADSPLIYNMLGKLEERNSLVLTHDDFFDYLESVFSGNGMPATLKDAIINAEYFLFIGMSFDQWYIHLFMRILRQHKEKLRAPKFAIPVPSLQSDICREQFTIRFIDADINKFMDELLEKCSTVKPLRLPKVDATETAEQSNNKDQFFNRLDEMVGNNEFDKLYENVKKILQGAGESGRAILGKFIELNGQSEQVKEMNRLGLFDSKEYLIALNKVRHGYSGQISQLRSEWDKLRIKL